MADRLIAEARSRLMSKIGPKNTRPEIATRSILHRLGYRFRLHRKDLPGSPDIVLPRFRAVVFVHGCFWHGHRCKKNKMPKSNTAYWGPKIETNRSRVSRKRRQLLRTGWQVIILWECGLKTPEKVAVKLLDRLRDT